MATGKFHGVNRADSFEELAHLSGGMPGGLRQIVHNAIDQLPDSELEVEFSYDMSDGGVTASVVVKVLGIARPLPVTYTRDQIVEQRNKTGTIMKG
jgi:hypothetical protein